MPDQAITIYDMATQSTGELISTFSGTLKIIAAIIAILGSYSLVNNYVVGSNAMAQSAMSVAKKAEDKNSQQDAFMHTMNARLIRVEEKLSGVDKKVSNLENAVRTNTEVTNNAAYQNSQMIKRLEELLGDND